MPESNAYRKEWFEIICQELAPTHGRMAGSLRTTLALVITILLLMILQIPAMAFGVFLIFLVSYETPYLTFQRGYVALMVQGAGAFAGIVLVEITGNSPLARVLGVALFAFIAAFIRIASVRFIFQPMDFAVFAIGSLTFFDSRLSDHQAVSLSLWPVAAGMIAVSSKVAIEYIFTRRNPYYDLFREIDFRFAALEALFLRFSSGLSSDAMPSEIAKVKQYAFMGQGKMHSLLQEIEDRHKKHLTHEINPSSIPVLARLLDLAAAFAVHCVPEQLSSAEKERLERLVRVINLLRLARWEEARENLQATLPSLSGELDRMEHSLMILAAFCVKGNSDEQNSEATTQAPRRRWLASDCFTNPTYAFFSFKVSICAMICFVICDALAWRGISTAVITVLVASLSSSGATNQKLLYRFLGSAIGGIVFGLGCIVFIFPYTDSIVSFLIAAGVVTFIGAWVVRSPHYSYIGLQIAFSYYLVVFTGFSAPQQMAPARDRLIGILVALLVMMLIFRPEKSVDKMRETFAYLLVLQAEYVKATAPHQPLASRKFKAMELREQMNGVVSAARGFTEHIAYEFSQDREEHRQAAEQIEQALLSSGDLLLSINSWPAEKDVPTGSERKTQQRTALEDGLRSLAVVLQKKSNCDSEWSNAGAVIRLQEESPSHVGNSIDIYKELYQCCRLIALCKV